MNIAYFVNQYPKITHSFIRREILALERQGFVILRIALRGWNEELVDAEDRQERTRTRYVLQAGLIPLLLTMLRIFVASPGRFFSSFALAIRMGRRADRPLPYHLVYLAEACRILPWLKSFGAAHVHAHFGSNSAEIVMLAHSLGGPPFSFTVHGQEEFDKPQFLGIAEKVRRAAFVVTISSYGRSQLYRWVAPEFWRKIHVVHCGLEPTYRNLAYVPSPVAPRLVCVGRMSDEKGHLLLIHAAARLAAKRIRFVLVLAGDGKNRTALEALIAEYGLGNRVRITGWISSDQVREEILAARGLVLPSFAEGLPIVIMEAMALRRPVLATYLAGIPELVLPGENGWLIPAGSIDDLTTAMEELLSKPLDQLQKMGEAAHRRVMERHSIDIEAAKLGVLFQKFSGHL